MLALRIVVDSSQRPCQIILQVCIALRGYISAGLLFDILSEGCKRRTLLEVLLLGWALPEVLILFLCRALLTFLFFAICVPYRLHEIIPGCNGQYKVEEFTCA